MFSTLWIIDIFLFKYLVVTYVGPPECVRDVQAQFLLCGGANPHEYALSRASVHLQAILLRAQEIGDEKLQEVQIIQDLIDNKQRSLDTDHKKLSEYLNNPEESEDDESADVSLSLKSEKDEVSSSDDLSPNDVELSSDEEVSQDEGELSSDDVEMSWSKDSDDEVMSDDDDSAMSENAEISDDLDDFISSTEKSEGTHLSGETFNTSD